MLHGVVHCVCARARRRRCVLHVYIYHGHHNFGELAPAHRSGALIDEPVPDIPTRAQGVDQVVRVWLQSVVSRLLDSEYPFLQKELFLHLDEDGGCSRGEGCKCDIYGNGTMVDCDAAGNASTACMYGAIMYVVTLAMSAGCCVMGKTKKATGVAGPM